MSTLKKKVVLRQEQYQLTGGIRWPLVSITSNEGTLNSASAVLEVSATNPEYNQPALRIKQAGKRGGAASIRIDDPNPDIEFVETGLHGY